MAHNNKQMIKVVEWSKKYMGCNVVPTKKGIRITPKEKKYPAWSCHPDDKGVFDFIRFLAKVAGVSKKELSDAIQQNTTINKDGTKV